MTADSAKAETSAIGCLIRLGVGIFLLLVILAAGIVAYASREHSKNKAALAVQVQQIRDRGEPLDGAELNEFYKVPAGMQDITAVYVKALDPLVPEPCVK